MGIKGIIAKAGGKAADGVSKLSSLSPEQLQQVQSQRDEYLTQMPNPNDSTAEELTKRLLAASSVEIYKAYLAQLKEGECVLIIICLSLEYSLNSWMILF